MRLTSRDNVSICLTLHLKESGKNPGPDHRIDYMSVDILPKAMMRVDIARLGFQECTFDAILCSHFLKRVPDDGKVLSELFRVLRSEKIGETVFGQWIRVWSHKKNGQTSSRRHNEELHFGETLQARHLLSAHGPHPRISSQPNYFLIPIL